MCASLLVIIAMTLRRIGFILGELAMQVGFTTREPVVASNEGKVAITFTTYSELNPN